MTLVENQLKTAKGPDMIEFRARVLVLICWQDWSGESLYLRSVIGTLRGSPATGTRASSSCWRVAAVGLPGHLRRPVRANRRHSCRRKNPVG